MSKIFLEILNNIITASYLIIAVVMIRFVLKKMPKWSFCLLWAMVAIRLVIPFEIESVFSLLPNSQTIKIESSQNKIYSTREEHKDAVYEQYLQNVLQENKEQIYTQNIGDAPEEGYEIIISEKNSIQYVLNIATCVWIIGILVFLIYAVVSIWRLKQKIATRILLHDNVYLCDEIESPFVMGVFKPGIYLSSNTPKDSWECILKHEAAHIKRADHIWKFVGYIILMVYWFHPLSWIAYILFCNDMELACDEKATKDMDQQQRANYCEALLKCSMKRSRINVCPVAFGEVGVKERIKQVLNYKKPSLWMMLLAVVICIVISVCFLTSPKKENEKDKTSDENMESVTEQSLNIGEKEDITEYDHIQPDERGYRWLSDEVYVYEFGDLDQNGVEEYAKVYQINTEQEYICRYTFYWNEEAIYEYENSYGMSPGEAEYLDLDRDGEKEIFLTFWPHANSMPLMEYIVLKQKADSSWKPLEMIHDEEIYQNAFPITVTRGKNEWEAVISCEGLEKTVTFDIAFYHTKLMELWEKDETESANFWMRLINDYKYGFPETSEWYTFGSVCAWGIWEIKSGEYQGQPCLIATHGIQGYDKSDFWGELDVYFNYDSQGKIRFLDMEFRNSEIWAGITQQTKTEFTMEELIALCDGGSEALENAMTNFSIDGELSYSNFEKNISELSWDYLCYLSYGGREYRLQVSYWKPEVAEKYGHIDNELENIFLFYPATRDGQLLYNAEEGYDFPMYNLDIRSFLGKEYNLEWYVDLDLPDDLKLGNYQMDVTFGQGCLFEGDYEEPFHGDGTPKDWYAPGGIEFIEKQYFSYFGDVRFEYGRLKEVAVLQNHSAFDSDFEFIENCDMQAVLCEAYFDLFTAAEAEEYMNEYGISEEEFPWHSRYWYVFFAEENSKYVYMLFLNQEYFEKEDIVELARSVKFKVK